MLDHRADEGAPLPTEAHDFCGTETDDRLSTWLDVLDRQVDLFLTRELAMLQRLPGWAQARALLDVGCGNGRYLAELSRRFPDKSCTGLETSAAFTAAARTEAPWLDVVEADYFAYRADRRFDLVLMRFVVQHLEDWGAVLDHAGTLLTPDGTLLVVEPDIAAFANTPPLPRFTQMLVSYGAAAASRGRLRASLDELGPQAAARGWHIASDQRDVVVNTGPDAGRRVIALYRGWMALCRQCGYVAADYAAVERELTAWGAHLSARSAIGLRFLALRPPTPVTEFAP